MGGADHPQKDVKGSRKRKLDAVIDSIPQRAMGNNPKYPKKHKCTGRDVTHGVILSQLNATVCMDFIDSVCYVDIQQWSGTKTINISPTQLHASLGKWMPHWSGGGGEISQTAANTFRAEVESIDKSLTQMAAMFGDSDEENEGRVYVETESF